MLSYLGLPYSYYWTTLAAFAATSDVSCRFLGFADLFNVDPTVATATFRAVEPCNRLAVFSPRGGATAKWPKQLSHDVFAWNDMKGIKKMLCYHSTYTVLPNQIPKKSCRSQKTNMIIHLSLSMSSIEHLVNLAVECLRVLKS